MEIEHWGERPLRAFATIAVIVMLLSFAPDIGLLVTNVVPGMMVAALATLMVMHVVTAVITVMLLERVTIRE